MANKIPDSDAPSERCWRCCWTCLRTVPFASILAFALNVIALSITLGCLLEGSIQMSSILQIDFRAVISGTFVTLVIIDVLFLLFAILSTGKVRSITFSQLVSIALGVCCQSVFILCAYILNAAWVIIACLLTVLVVIITTLTFVCNTLDFTLTTACLTLAELGLPMNTSYCGPTGQTFCRELEMSSSYLIASLIGSILGSWSMVIFLMAMSANFVHIRYRLLDDEVEDEIHEMITDYKRTRKQHETEEAIPTYCKPGDQAVCDTAREHGEHIRSNQVSPADTKLEQHTTV